MSMRTVTARQLANVLDDVVDLLHEPLLIHGAPGIGKSSIGRQFSERRSALHVPVLLSQYDSVDVRGFPDIDREARTTRWVPPATLPFIGNDAFPDDQPIDVFLDELGNATQAVQGVAYQLVLEGRVGEHRLKPNVRVYAATNRDGDKGATHRMVMPLNNRFTHVELVEDVESWCYWGQLNGIAPIVVAYLQWQKGHLNTFDPSRPDKAFATPRTWEKANKYYLNCRSAETRDISIVGAIGEATAHQFFAFEQIWKALPDIKEILRNPLGVRLPEKMDQRYAATVSVSGHLSVKTATPLAQYIGRLQPEFQMLAWKLACNRDKAIYGIPEFITYAEQNASIFL